MVEDAHALLTLVVPFRFGVTNVTHIAMTARPRKVQSERHIIRICAFAGLREPSALLTRLAGR
jgi:hypothetical protein